MQIDDAYLGGERNGGKPGRGSGNRRSFVIAVSTDAGLGHPHMAAIDPLWSFDNASLKEWTARRLEPECEVYADALACLRRLEDAGHAHTTLVTADARRDPSADQYEHDRREIPSISPGKSLHVVPGWNYTLSQVSQRIPSQLKLLKVNNHNALLEYAIVPG